MTHEAMTDRDKHQFLDDQIRKGGSVFCPWCSSINHIGDEGNPCCRAFSFAIQERADGLMRNFANQYTAVEVGMSSSITCPYCHEVNRAPGSKDPADWKRPTVNPFCCDLFCAALTAHLEVKRLKSLVHRADKLAEAIDKAARN